MKESITAIGRSVQYDVIAQHSTRKRSLVNEAHWLLPSLIRFSRRSEICWLVLQTMGKNRLKVGKQHYYFSKDLLETE